jgi:DNA-binding CsgD family transcriptional regulator
MSEKDRVWARMVVAVADGLLREGYSIDGLFGGLSFDAASVRRLRWVSWSEYGVVCEHAVRITGGDEEIQKFLESGYHQTLPEIRMIAGALIEPKPFLRFMFEVLTPPTFPAFETEYEDLGDERFRASLRLHPGLRPCAAFFIGAVGAVRGVTRHLDLPPVIITQADIGPTHGIYSGIAPKSRTIASRAVRVSREVVARSAAKLLISVNGGEEARKAPDLAPDEVRFNDAIVSWDLTQKQSEVLKLLVRGLSNKEIAHSLGCADNTVELHVTLILKKAHVTSRSQIVARFWSGS